MYKFNCSYTLPTLYYIYIYIKRYIYIVLYCVLIYKYKLIYAVVCQGNAQVGTCIIKGRSTTKKFRPMLYIQ